MDRRRFLHLLAIAASSPALSVTCRADDPKIGPLRPDPDQILDLPEGYQYKTVSRAGDMMSDGFRVPNAHDGMAAFPADNGCIILVCNHEIQPAFFKRGAFGDSYATLPQAVKDNIYDQGGGRTPGVGGTTTTVYNPQTGQTEKQHLSLAGTELNCAGGPTPWGSWLSCEECFELPGTGWSAGQIVRREQPHGYVFEVPAHHDGLVEPVPIKAMGRFEHEAAAVHASTGIVYMTEDRHHSLFYRYIPNVPGKLHEGGKLQALAIDKQPSFMTHNWSREPQMIPGESMASGWLDLDDVEPLKNDLRLRGATMGAATFARGEGLCVAGDEFVFTCTIGGPARLGQIFSYRPSPQEGRPGERSAPGQLKLIAEASHESILRNADNLTMAPWGDLIVCEDTSSNCGLVGIRPDGSQYQLADNAHTTSELAGVCFSPDGKTLFVNIQYPGMTVAITGPFPA
ncbi:MAG: PhoX family protein [Gammaproteobacteria bacterium]|nr:PhoX family protein [Gammaproteobacteria bacterium]MDH3751766.1 PhoX family protein [Gammaproteobacteria bacterium]MDH3804749.1 PhoX family protein [Gammaproteobacteria bacterium]